MDIECEQFINEKTGTVIKLSQISLLKYFNILHF